MTIGPRRTLMRITDMNDKQFDRFMKALLIAGLFAAYGLASLADRCDGGCTQTQEAHNDPRLPR